MDDSARRQATRHILLYLMGSLVVWPGIEGMTNMCDSGPCRNNATCVGTAFTAQCFCTPSYTGPRCESQVTPDTTSDGSKSVLLPAVVVSSTVVLWLVIAILCVMRRRRRKSTKPK
ncbi:neurogenic locus protein delta-like [Sycon ciliatum]|uniref:neurogenic locus protein delta-like n=1 Tax=Sycon ciliatum TaxID=27933 RepID=UPI0031F63793